MKEKTARLQYILAVLLFGLNPIFIRFTDAPSEVVALVRAALGLCTLIIICLVTRRKFNFPAIKKKFPVLVMAGICLAFNWIFLFAAYANIKVSVASLCNYMAPIIAVALSPLVLKEKMPKNKIPCIIAAFVGIVFVSGVLDGDLGSLNVPGLLTGAMAAVTFVGCIFSNKKLQGVGSIESVVMQLVVALCVLIPYVLIRNGGIPLPTDSVSIVMLLIIGIINSGFAYLFYYGPMPYMPVQAIAILGYLEPVVCIILSVFLFGEPISAIGIVGAVLIIGATIVSEVLPNKENKTPTEER